MNTRIHLAISPCPNDTFLFHGLLAGKVELRGLNFDVEYLDIEELNRRLFAGDFDVAKASFHAALLLAADTVVLPTGSALGFGVGPLLLASKGGIQPRDPVRRGGKSGPARVLCPGQHTTAALLYRLFHPNEGQVEQVLFSKIMPMLMEGVADFGVVIHEGRFTYQDQGLVLVEDLGAVWEKSIQSPLPLGGLLARRRLSRDVMTRVQHVLRDSLDYGFAHRGETVTTMHQHAQELDEAVMFAHVDTYVNEWTRDLGPVGRQALQRLHESAVGIGLVPAQPVLEIFDSHIRGG